MASVARRTSLLGRVQAHSHYPSSTVLTTLSSRFKWGNDHTGGKVAEKSSVVSYINESHATHDTYEHS